MLSNEGTYPNTCEPLSTCLETKFNNLIAKKAEGTITAEECDILVSLSKILGC